MSPPIAININNKQNAHFYLEKICRICVRNERTLLNCNSEDYDRIVIGDKIQACSGLHVENEDLICLSCIKKLRISYSFRVMCIKSTDILNNYLKELMGTTQLDKFDNTELKVQLDRVDVPIKQELVSDGEDNDLTLETNENNNNVNSNVTNYIRVVPTYKILQNNSEYDQESDRARKKRVSKEQRCSLLKKLLSTPKFEKKINDELKKPKNKHIGGLKSLLGFIKNYDFGSKSKKDVTHLDRLEAFSKSFFYNNFTEYREVILRVINDKDDSEDDGMLDDFDVEEDMKLWGIKTIKEEQQEYEEILPCDLVQTCFEDNNVELQHPTQDHVNYVNAVNSMNSVTFDSYFRQPHMSAAASSSLDMLKRLAGDGSSGNLSKNYGKPPISRNSLKCRTRNHPFINPKLMEQFRRRSFRCDTCNRCFKSPGYLQSHCTKMGH